MSKTVTFSGIDQVKEMSVDMDEHSQEVKNPPEHIVNIKSSSSTSSSRTSSMWYIIFFLVIVVIFYIIYRRVGKIKN